MMMEASWKSGRGAPTAHRGDVGWLCLRTVKVLQKIVHMFFEPFINSVLTSCIFTMHNSSANTPTLLLLFS